MAKEKEGKAAALLFALLFALAPLLPAQAATLTARPASANGSYSAGQLFPVSVYVSTTDDEPMNAVSGTLSFPTDLLQIVSVDKTGSIVSFWITDPTFSNVSGQAQFEGGVYNPGYAGTAGKIATFLFRAKAAGTATISFLSASVLANDGKGTNILDQTEPARIAIGTGSVPPAASGISAIPVTSSTHPDQTRWYASKDVSLSWQVPASATALRFDADQDPQGLPKTVSVPSASAPALPSSAELSLPDGVSYFHIQARDAVGWGPVSTFKIQIDSVPVEPPAFDRFPVTLTEGDPLLISGTALPSSTVDIYLTDSSGLVSNISTQVGPDGHFQAVWNKRLGHDSYSLNGETVNQHGIASPRSADMTITVRQGALDRVAWPILNFVTIAIVGITLIAFAVLWTWYLLHYIRRFRKKVRSGVKKADQAIHLQFKSLLEKARSRRALTAEEDKILSTVRRALGQAEDKIEEKVNEIGE